MRGLLVLCMKVLKRIWSIIFCLIWKALYWDGFSIGKKTFFYPGCHITVEDKGKLTIGNNCFFNSGCSINCMGSVAIGNNCIFGEAVKIYDHNHNFKISDVPFKKQGYTVSTVKVGDNCWIGSNVVILPNVTIGDNVVIAAGTIVTKTVPSGCVIRNKIQIIEKRIEE